MELFGTVLSLAYLLLEIRQHRWMWLIGFLSAAVYAYVFFGTRIYAQMCLQVYYAAVSVYGFLSWRRAAEEADGGARIRYRRLRAGLAIGLAALLLGAWAMLYLLLRHTNESLPLLDAFTAAAGAVATWMTARRLLESWWLWMLADFVSVGMYAAAHLYPTLLLYLCYTVASLIGYLNWKRKGELIMKN
ncbi:MAG: nicotinamide riboside transporter PnuC [Tannerella sp.]|jgi:nicotinamide mononucleotide transporter|nr:nicotinamide riboside transporter PnuC [Tannerella sp.]